MADNEILTLNAVAREDTGKTAAKNMRREGTIPGVYYHSGEEAIHLQFNLHEVQMLLRERPTVINLVFGKGKDDSRECMIREIQRHPVTHYPMHVDLIGITRGQKINTTVGVELIGIPAGVRNEGGVLQQAMSRVDIICLPKDMPKVIEVDVTNLELGDSIHLNEISVEGVEWDDNPERTIATVILPRISTEEEEEAEGEGEELEGAEEGEGAGEEESGDGEE